MIKFINTRGRFSCVDANKHGARTRQNRPRVHNIRYAAAYLSYIQDLWKSEYPEIDGRTAILATLYNIGENGSSGPNDSPKSKPFGDFAKDNYYYMQELLGLE